MAEVNLAEIKFGGRWRGDRQTDILNSPPNFPAIRYVILSKYNQKCLFSHVLHVEWFCISTVYIIRMSFSASNNFIIVVTVVFPHVCVPVRSFMQPRASTCFFYIL